MVELLTRAFPEALIFYNRGDRRLKCDVLRDSLAVGF